MSDYILNKRQETQPESSKLIKKKEKWKNKKKNIRTLNSDLKTNELNITMYGEHSYVGLYSTINLF